MNIAPRAQLLPFRLMSLSARSGRLVMIPATRLSLRKRFMRRSSSTVQTQTGMWLRAQKSSASSLAYSWSRGVKSALVALTSLAVMPTRTPGNFCLTMRAEVGAQPGSEGAEHRSATIDADDDRLDRRSAERHRAGRDLLKQQGGARRRLVGSREHE